MGSCGMSSRQRKEVFITGPNPEVLQLYLGKCLNDFSGDWSEEREKKGLQHLAPG